MADPVIIRIGAAVDQSVERAFQTAEQRANRAARAMAASGQKGSQETSASIERESRRQQQLLDRAARAQDRLYERNARNAAKGAAEREKAEARAAAAAERASQKAALSAEKAAARAAAAAKKQSDAFADSFTEFANVAAREMRKVEQATERANRIAGERFASRTSYAAARFLTPHAPLASMARRAASDLARGAGVDLSFGSSVSRNVERESLAASISNSGYQEGVAGPAGRRVASSDVLGQASSAAQKYHLDPTQVLEGLSGFVKRTGDLDLGLKSLDKVTKLAAASNTPVADMFTAAGASAMNLKGVSDKAGALDALLRNLISQGKLGAVEMEDFATQMAKIAPQANRFAGNSSDNIKQLAALAQLSMATGGATSAQQAATSVGRLVDTLATPSRAKAFTAAGIDVETTNANGMKVLRDPVSVILDALRKTNADPIKLKSLLSSSIGARPAEALAGYYRDAGGGAVGEANVKAKLAEFAGGKFSDTAIDQSLAETFSTTASKAQDFQNKLDGVVQKTQAQLLPALEKLEPAVLKLADAFGNVATWAAGNPGQAVATAISLSIARAGLENVFRSGIERLLLGASEQNATKLGGITGAAGSALTIASMAIATIQVSKMVVDWMNSKDKETADKATTETKDVNAKARELMGSGNFAQARNLLEEQAKKDADAAAQTDQGTALGSNRNQWVKALIGQVLGGGEAGLGVGGKSDEGGLFGLRKLLGITDKDLDKSAGAAEESRKNLLNASQETNKLLGQAVSSLKAIQAKPVASLEIGAAPGVVSQH